MPHIFDPGNAHELESEKRRKILPVEPFINLAKRLPEEMRKVAFDIGAGTGYYTVPLSRIFEKVYAVEISSEMALFLRKRLEEEGVENVGIIVTGKPPDINFRINLCLFSNVLHEMEQPQEYLNWAAEKSDVVVVIDWKKVETEFGPPLDERIEEDAIVKMLESAGLEVERLDAYPYHYFLVAKRLDIPVVRE
jgi:SAM-dependent methyltransferase